MAVDYPKLKTELALPEYAALDNVAAAAHLMGKTAVTATRKLVPAHELYEAMVPTEWENTSAQEKQRIENILSMGTADLGGTNTRAALAAAFGAGTQSRANILALRNETRPYVVVQGIADASTVVNEYDVQIAKDLP